jgi:hypothetical protein
VYEVFPPFDAFVTMLTPDGGDLVYSTFLGGQLQDRAWGVTVDPSGVVTVAGDTGGFAFGTEGFPVTPGALQTEPGFDQDTFVSRLSPLGDRLFYSTYLGTSTWEESKELATDSRGAAFVAGRTSSPDFPTTPGAYSETYIGGQTDIFVAKLSLMFEGTGLFGQGAPSCLGDVRIGLTAAPIAQTDGFGIYASAAPPSSVGLLLIGVGSVRQPLLAHGAEIRVDAMQGNRVLDLVSDSHGYVEVPLVLPSDLIGTRVHAQVLIAGTESCSAASPWSASPSIAFLVQ